MIQQEVPYPFDDDEALARLRALTDYWSARHGVHTVWEGSRASLKGRKLGVKYDASAEVGGGLIRARVSVGVLAEKLGGPAYVRRKLAEYLDPAHTVETLRSRIPR